MSAWDRFDGRYYIDYAGDGGIAAFRREMDRVGFDGSGVVSADSVFDDVLLRYVRHAGNVGKSSINITLGHYRAVRHAHDRGCAGAVFLETDVRFLIDVRAVWKSVEALPDDYDVALFDWAVPKGGVGDAGIGEERGGWARFGCLRSCGCWALSRRGMECWLEMVERVGYGGKLRQCDMYHGKMVEAGMNGYCAVPPACVQREHAGSNTGYSVIAKRYEMAGIDLTAYGV